MRFVSLTGKEDRARLLAIAEQDMSVGYHAALERELDDIARGASRGICAIDGTAPVGYAVYHRTAQTYHLDTIAVDRSRRGAGIGTALLASVRADLRQAGPTILNVVTDAAARETLAFYARQGFVLAGAVRDEFLAGVTQVHLTQEIR
jgi:[ribosomal protein S18]-alanine N-acetyltransferase